MGLWDMLKTHAGAQFLDVVEWLDDSNDTLVWRFPVFNQAITDNSKLIVREGQAAVFVSEGKLSDVFGPGTYDLDTRNAPITSFFKSIAYQFEYPYKGDIYFVSTRQFMDNGWGTATPIMLRDAEFGPVRIRAYGVYSFRITDPADFIRQVVGTDGLFTTSEITGQLKKKLIASFASAVGAAKIPVLDLAANYLAMGDQLKETISPQISESYGVSLTDFTIQSISLPEAVEKALDERSKMGVLGDLDKYTQLKAADAIEIAAANTGIAGAGMGMGVGFGMGNMMGAQMGQSMGGGNSPQGSGGPPPLPGASGYHYSGPAGQGQKSLADVVRAVTTDRSGAHLVWQQGWSAWKPWSEVPEIASQIPPELSSGPPPLPGAGASYHYNGPAGTGEKSLAEIVQAVDADPTGGHHVWQKGWDGWKPAADVPEIASQLDAGDEPPPPPAP